MHHLRKTSSAVVLLSPAQPAHRKCWLFQQMETESYIAFAETEGDLSSSLFIDLFSYFIYLMDGFSIFLSSSALMILVFLRGSLWLKTVRCLDLLTPYRKQ